jgi:SpoOM protein
MTVTTTRSDGGVAFRLDLDADRVLPGRIVTGRVRIDFQQSIEVRGIVASLIATEMWQTTDTETDANGTTRTETETHHQELRRLPVMLAGPSSFATGEAREFQLELPVPPLGPATFEATVAALTWRLEVKLDIPGFDPDVTVDVVVLQPTALLRAGVIDVGPFALYPSADVDGGDARGSIALDPVPVCIGAPFGGLVSVATGRQKLQEVRLELRSRVEVTAVSGKDEQVTLWTGRIAGEGEFGGGDAAAAFDGTVPDRWVPTIDLPHSRARGTFHVILAKAWSQDTHLVRDVAICSTTEL